MIDSETPNYDSEELNKALRQEFERYKSAAPDNAHVKSHPIEVYFQDNILQDMMSVGCYDLFSRKWLVGPELKD